MVEEISPDNRPQDPILKTVVDLIVKIGVLIILIFFCIQDPLTLCKHFALGHDHCHHCFPSV